MSRPARRGTVDSALRLLGQQLPLPLPRLLLSLSLVGSGRGRRRGRCLVELLQQAQGLVRQPLSFLQPAHQHLDLQERQGPQVREPLPGLTIHSHGKSSAGAPLGAPVFSLWRAATFPNCGGGM